MLIDRPLIHGAAELRASFDRAFAEPSVQRAEDWEGFLALRVAHDLYAFRMREISAVLADQKIIPLPSPAAEFLGIIGFRARIIPIYSLRGLLRYPSGDPARWIALLRSDEPVGLAFDEYEGHLRLARTELAPYAGASGPADFVQEAAQTISGARPILAVSLLLDSIKRRTRSET